MHFRTVISTPSSARMSAAYDVASSAVDILNICGCAVEGDRSETCTRVVLRIQDVVNVKFGLRNYFVWANRSPTTIGRIRSRCRPAELKFGSCRPDKVRKGRINCPGSPYWLPGQRIAAN